MKRVVLILMVVCAALAAAASPALATDLCIANSFNNIHIVGKGFIIPRKNTCKPFIGFLTHDNLGAMVAGAGCTSFDGQLLRIHVTAHGADFNFFDSLECDFLLPSLTGGNCQLKIITLSGSSDVIISATELATATRCTANNNP